ncbi:Peptidyl-dipeptidase [Balamuthia mandrillaris]
MAAAAAAAAAAMGLGGLGGGGGRMVWWGCCIFFLILLCASSTTGIGGEAKAGAGAEAEAGKKPSLEKWLEEVNDQLSKLSRNAGLAQWKYATNLTTHNSEAAVMAEQELLSYLAEAIRNASAYITKAKASGSDGPRRQVELLRRVTIPLLDEEKKQKQLSELISKMEGIYGAAKVPLPASCTSPSGNEKREGEAQEEKVDLEELSWRMAHSTDYDCLLDMWVAWRNVSREMRPLYSQFVNLSNDGARQMGFDDTGDLWRSGYDMEPQEFVEMIERLWDDVKPLYEDLHCYVRSQLVQRYGADKFPPNGAIPAHLLGNMWAQDWSNLQYDLVNPSLDITPQLAKWNEADMVHAAHDFFTNLGLDPLPPSFWDNSLFLKPDNRDVVCHASAWDLGQAEDDTTDVRLKMCITKTGEDFETLHHELGHIFYYTQYATQPYLFRSGANDGFHEGIGDTMALSITPEYLQGLGLLNDTAESNTTQQLLAMALKKVAFLPFGLLVDVWRWKVFNGEASEQDYNQLWWKLRYEYQGIVPPIEQTKAGREQNETLFDAGAKYHIPANTPYMRYFLAHILQFQFHEALCKAANIAEPLHLCSINGSTVAGAKLKVCCLSLSLSRPKRCTLPGNVSNGCKRALA